MKKDSKVLILYARYGEGHIQVSKALQTTFYETGVKDVVLKDLFAEAHPLIDTVTRAFYKKSYTLGSVLYGWFYNYTKKMKHDTMLSRWFNSFGTKKLREYIYQEKPDLVINTFPMLAMPELCRRDGIFIPVYTVVTDFTLHNRWIHPDITRHYVPTLDIKNMMIEEGIESHQIMVCGIPLREQFNTSSYSFSLFEKYGLSASKKTVLIMADFHSRKKLKKICSELLSLNRYQLMIVCGRNQPLKEELEKDFSEEASIRILGYVEDMHLVMKMASCIVTKAGGITLSEALSMSVPPVIYSPVAGQERENARYLAGKGAAIISDQTEDLVYQVDNLLQSDERLAEMHEAIQLLKKPNAAKTIIQDILKNVEINTVSLRSILR
ncbi:glycosyltransferase [Aneurinibacillus sp. Ricciae_BoGa-3]|uniref:MGDG synthase family glycosyltransferase n=1 Tax=Aneurinibacillus sp. Ricciae_BoGa-3 TaxID=3022697 RepID=UPI0023421CAB|nr:glycosyltransferase [Aneurinibacillus sp. Ricciae_BoGa-3]WCK56517.1 glycosyltransferase [Aneurinibacillus sp. Ricciae_BoGa-3]